MEPGVEKTVRGYMIRSPRRLVGNRLGAYGHRGLEECDRQATPRGTLPSHAEQRAI